MQSQIQYKEENDNALNQCPSIYTCLNNKDVISSQVSDHHPIVHDGVLFWNVMMQGKRRGNGFNNGFGLAENDRDYKARMIKVAHVIAEAVRQDSSIEAICVCEGPIKTEHIEILYDTLKSFPWMQRFISEEMFHKPNEEGPEWGLLMLADVNYQVVKKNSEEKSNFPKLANRFQLWELVRPEATKYIALAHFPFSGDVYKTQKTDLSLPTQTYCHFIQDILNRYEDKNLIFCADFNFNPYLIGLPTERAFDQIINHSSILLNFEEKSGLFNTEAVTVDGVLLSQKEKQKYMLAATQQGLVTRLKNEYRFFKTVVKDVIVKKEPDEQLRLDSIMVQAG